MFSLRNSGDSLAGEFSRLLKKTAAVHVDPNQMEIAEEDEYTKSGQQTDAADDMAVSPEDFLLTPEESDEADSIDNALDSSIKSFSSHFLSLIYSQLFLSFICAFSKSGYIVVL